MMKSRMLHATLMASVLLFGLLAAPALAEYPAEYPPEVLPEPPVDVEEPPVDVEEPPVAAPDPIEPLPVTGADALTLAIAGLGLLGVGSMALRRRDPGEVS